MKKILSLVLALALVLASCAVAFADDPVTHKFSTESTTHTYQIYQIYTGTYNNGQLQNLKYGKNAAKGTEGDSVSETEMAELDAIATASYDNDQAKIAALSEYVKLSGTPIAEIGKGKDASATLADGYYLIKDTDESLADPEGYTLYLFQTLHEDTVIKPKDGTTIVDKTVTETNDTTGAVTDGQKGADYDEGDSIPYSIDITLAKNVHDYKEYEVTLTDTLSEGLTAPAEENITVTLTKGGDAVDAKFGTPTVTVEGQKITVTYSYGDGTNAIGVEDLDNAVINVSYEAVLNSKAKVGVEGNPNTYTITYSNNPNGDDKGTTPEEKVYVFTYELNIIKVDGNAKPLQGAGFTLYKEVTSTYEGAQTGAAIKPTLDTKVNASKLDDAKYYVPVSMTENVTKNADEVVTAVTHKTDKKIDSGKYVLIETTVPAGYNAFEGQEITITATIDEKGELKSVTKTPESLTISSDLGTLEGNVENNSGTTLPSTGGIGTTIFYILGGVLVIGAAVILVARRKAEDK